MQASGEEEDPQAAVLSIKAYLRALCPTLLTLTADAVAGLDEQLSTEANTDCIARFASNAEYEVLCVEVLESNATSHQGINYLEHFFSSLALNSVYPPNTHCAILLTSTRMHAYTHEHKKMLTLYHIC